MKRRTSRLFALISALALLGSPYAFSACSPSTPSGDKSANPLTPVSTSSETDSGRNSGAGADELEDKRYLSDGTAYEWDGELINYRAEWEDFLASLPSRKAIDVLDTLDVAPWDSHAGYARENFGERWVDVDGNGCSTRNDILGRDLTGITYTSNKYRCVVKSGELDDPYSGQQIHFERSESDEVQIDHIVALYNAWRTGAQDFSYEDRVAIANDPYNLIAVDGDTNYEKSDGDASRWLPRDEDFRCEYVARQIGVKARYNLWVTEKEKGALRTVLNVDCQGTELPSYDTIR